MDNTAPVECRSAPTSQFFPEGFELYPRNPFPLHMEGPRRRQGDVDDSGFDMWPAVGDLDGHHPAIAQIGDPDQGAER